MMASGAGAKTGHLNEKTRQLISQAVAVTIRCDSSIFVHAAKAVHSWARREEVAEALCVVRVVMNAGGALRYLARALDAVESVS